MGALTIAGLALAPAAALAQASPPNYVELRAAHSEDGLYRYVEYSRFFRAGRSMLPPETGVGSRAQ